MEKPKNLESLASDIVGKILGTDEIVIIPEMTSEQLIALESGKRPTYTEMGYLALIDNNSGYGGTLDSVYSARRFGIPLNEKRVQAVLELEGDGGEVAMVGRGRVNDSREKVYFYFKDGEGELFSFAQERILSYKKS